MAISNERLQQIVADYQKLKDKINGVDTKYSLSYVDPELDLPETLGLQPLEFVAKTDEQLQQQAELDTKSVHINRQRNAFNSYNGKKRTLEAKRATLQNNLEQSLQQLQAEQQQQLAKATNHLVQNGTFVSTLLQTIGQQIAQTYQALADAERTQATNQLAVVSSQLQQLETNYQALLSSIEQQHASDVAERMAELVEQQNKEQQRVQKYNTTLEEKETKFQASRENSLDYARQREYERALAASKLYAEIGESGVTMQKLSEKLNLCQRHFITYRQEEALLVVNSDSFLQVHLAEYYSQLLDYISTLPA